MKRFKKGIIIVFVLCCVVNIANAAQKIIYGHVEQITIMPDNFILPAKLDTGAKSSSINAQDIKIFKKDGVEWVSFSTELRKGRKHKFEEKLLDYVKIKVRAGEQESDDTPSAIKRPVVQMKIKLANKEQLIEVNLADRSRFIYPFLLGRDAIIKFNGIVDPSVVDQQKLMKQCRD